MSIRFDIPGVYWAPSKLLRGRLINGDDGSNVAELALAEQTLAGGMSMYSGTSLISNPPDSAAAPYRIQIRQVTAQTTVSFNDTATAQGVVPPSDIGYIVGGFYVPQLARVNVGKFMDVQVPAAFTNTAGSQGGLLVLGSNTGPFNIVCSGTPVKFQNTSASGDGFEIVGSSNPNSYAINAHGERGIKAFGSSGNGFEIYNAGITINDGNGFFGVNVVDVAGAAANPGTEISTSGTLQTGSTSTTANLATTASAVDGYYVGQNLRITSGTGAGQSRIITGYVGSTKVATLDRAWATTPTTSGYAVIGVDSPATTLLGGTVMSKTDVEAFAGNTNAASVTGSRLDVNLTGSITRPLTVIQRDISITTD